MKTIDTSHSIPVWQASLMCQLAIGTASGSMVRVISQAREIRDNKYEKTPNALIWFDPGSS